MDEQELATTTWHMHTHTGTPWMQILAWYTHM